MSWRSSAELRQAGCLSTSRRSRETMDAIDVKADRIRGHDIAGRRSPFAGTLHLRILPECGLCVRGASRPVLSGKGASCGRSTLRLTGRGWRDPIGDETFVARRGRSRVLRPARWPVRWRADGSHELGVFAGTPASVRSAGPSFGAWQAGQPALSGDHRRWAFVDGVDDLGVVDAAEIHRGNGNARADAESRAAGHPRATSPPRARDAAGAGRSVGARRHERLPRGVACGPQRSPMAARCSGREECRTTRRPGALRAE